MNSKIQERLDKILEDYDSSKYHLLPKVVKRRVDALKKIQLDHIQIQLKYHKELQALELKYEELYKPLYEKRHKIVSGEHEPTDEECELPSNITAHNDFNGDQENDNTELELKFQDSEEEVIKNNLKGVPNFWLGCLTSTYNFEDSIEPHDKKVLKYLSDIRLSYNVDKEDLLSYRLEFFFDNNPYFTNSSLTKTYHLKMKPDEKDPFSYEGFEVASSEGCDISWNPGKNITVKTKTVKQQNKRDGRKREKLKEIECDSFFYFFKPPQMPEGEDELDEELGAIMAVDFELGEVLRQSIIPKASLYYSGYMVDDEDDDDDDDEDDLDSEGLSSADNQESSEDDQESSDEDLDESLESKPKDKKKISFKKD